MSIELDTLGILEGTDKCSIGHGYLRHYERILGNLRHVPLTLLEIGIHRGASLRMWSEYFERGTIIGVDIQPDCRKYAGGRREVEIGSQADVAFLNEVGQRWQPHVIVDDGSHKADHVLLTFQTLFPYLRDGGIYIVEDLHFHSGDGSEAWRGQSDIAPPEVFLRLAHLVSCPNAEGSEGRDIAKGVDGIEFFYGAVAIRKKPAHDPGVTAKRRPLVEQANKAEMWAGFAMQVLNESGDVVDAIRCAKRAIELNPDEASFRHVLSLILERGGDLPGALGAAEDAARLNPLLKGFQTRVDQLRTQ